MTDNSMRETMKAKWSEVYKKKRLTSRDELKCSQGNRRTGVFSLAFSTDGKQRQSKCAYQQAQTHLELFGQQHRLD